MCRLRVSGWVRPSSGQGRAAIALSPPSPARQQGGPAMTVSLSLSLCLSVLCLSADTRLKRPQALKLTLFSRHLGPSHDRNGTHARSILPLSTPQSRRTVLSGVLPCSRPAAGGPSFWRLLREERGSSAQEACTETQSKKRASGSAGEYSCMAWRQVPA